MHSYGLGIKDTTMKVKLTSIYENNGVPERDLKGSSGNAFLLEYGSERILFDVGFKGKILLHNMDVLHISADAITKIIFSHGHLDHTWGLPKLLDRRTNIQPIQIYGGNNLLDVKKAKILGIRAANIGYPTLSLDQEKKIEYHLSFDPINISDFLKTTGRISERPEKDGVIKKIVHKHNNEWETDPLEDDLSLILQTTSGVVIIGGCMHSGLLNTCAHVKKLFPDQPITSVIGGTHMIGFSKEDVAHVADEIRDKYKIDKLHLNHCTGKKAIEQLTTILGSDIVLPFHVGSTLEFEC